MLPKRILIIGSRGHAHAVAGVIQALGEYGVAGLIDSTRKKGNVCFGYPVLGGIDDLERVVERGRIENISVAIGDCWQREQFARVCRKVAPGLKLPAMVHPAAVVAKDAEIGEGVVVMPSATVVAGCVVGEGCVLNTGCVLDHDGILEPWSSLAPGAVVGGGVRIGRRAFVGLGARVRHKVEIGADTVVGAGALVLSDLPQGVLAYGSPCRVIRHREPDERYL